MSSAYSSQYWYCVLQSDSLLSYKWWMLHGHWLWRLKSEASMLESSNTISCWQVCNAWLATSFTLCTCTWMKTLYILVIQRHFKTFHETFFISVSRLAPSQLAPSRLAPSQLYGEWKAITLPVTTGANIMFHALKNTQTQFIVCLCVCMTNYDLTVLFSNNLTWVGWEYDIFPFSGLAQCCQSRKWLSGLVAEAVLPYMVCSGLCRSKV